MLKRELPAWSTGLGKRRAWSDIFFPTTALRNLIKKGNNMSAQLSEAEFVALGGARCPNCQSTDLEGHGTVDADGPEATAPERCKSCGATWDSIFRLSGYAGLEDEDGDPIAGPDHPFHEDNTLELNLTGFGGEETRTFEPKIVKAGELYVARVGTYEAAHENALTAVVMATALYLKNTATSF